MYQPLLNVNCIHPVVHFRLCVRLTKFYFLARGADKIQFSNFYPNIYSDFPFTKI